MSGTKSPQTGLTRRSFLKTTGAVAGVAAVGAAASLEALSPSEALAADSAEEQVFVNNCRGNCGGRCSLDVTVREGKVVRVTAGEFPEEERENRRRICVKGYSQPQRMYDPDRLKYPMKRVEGTERGAGQWERISWDEAIDTIAGKMKTAIDEHGGGSLGFWSSYGSYSVLNGMMAGNMSVAYGRFISRLGATVLGAGADNAQIHEQMTLLGVNGNDATDIVNAKTILVWGGNPAEAYVQDWRFVCTARERGAKVITIDPQFTAAAAHSDEWIAVRPGTDGALMLGMANYIIDNDLIDEEFMAAKTVSPFLVKEDGTYMRMSDLGVAPTEGPINPMTGQPTVIDLPVVWDTASDSATAAPTATAPAILGQYEVQGQAVQTVYQKVKDSIREYTVEKAAEISDLTVEQVEHLARAYAEEGPVTVLTFQGIGHHVNSHHNYKNLSLLAALTGNAGKPGAMLTRRTGGMFPVNMKHYFAGAGPSANVCGMYLPQIVNEGKVGNKDIDIQVLWIACGNVLSCESGRVELIEAVKKVPFIVCADMCMTDTAKWADIVLPIPHSFETEDFEPVCMTPFPTYYHKAVDPYYESKMDLDIMRLLDEAMGTKIYDRSNEEYLRDALDTPANLKAGAGYDAFHKGDLVRNYTYTEKSFIDDFSGAKTGRLEYYIEKPTPRNNFGQEIADSERIPYYEPAHEAYWENPLREKYPLMGCSQHGKYQSHSQYSHTPWIRELDPEPQIKINGSDAAERGIAQGDLVRAFNDRGHVVLKALVTEGIKPGVVSIPHGFQEDQFVEGHAQDLTSAHMNDFCSNSAFYDFLCEVEKYEGGNE